MGSTISQSIILFPDIINECICDYLLNDIDCRNFLKVCNKNPDKYRYIYNVYSSQNYYPNNVRQLILYDSDKDYIRLPSLVRLIIDSGVQKQFSLSSKMLSEIVCGDGFDYEITLESSHITHVRLGKYYSRRIHDLPKCLLEIKVYHKYKYLKELQDILGDRVQIYKN